MNLVIGDGGRPVLEEKLAVREKLVGKPGLSGVKRAPTLSVSLADAALANARHIHVTSAAAAIGSAAAAGSAVAMSRIAGLVRRRRERRSGMATRRATLGEERVLELAHLSERSGVLEDLGGD